MFYNIVLFNFIRYILQILFRFVSVRQKLTTGAWVLLTALERTYRPTCYRLWVRLMPTCICARKIFAQVSSAFCRFHSSALITSFYLFVFNSTTYGFSFEFVDFLCIINYLYYTAKFWIDVQL